VRMLGLLYRGAVVRARDHFFAPERREVGVCWGIVGLDFFIFGSRGVARKWSRMRTGWDWLARGESASTGGGVGEDSRVGGGGWLELGRWVVAG